MAHYFSIQSERLAARFTDACDDPDLLSLASGRVLAAVGNAYFDVLFMIRASGMDTHPKIEPIWEQLNQRFTDTQNLLESRYPKDDDA
ncbi:hypothetical protein [Candidatus Poriferisodalis sp.]|uniref:hypothetical protein n=1 Tax=Candidatus Poriferisodalis sp. TaxID=3101277 RepID=UPI003B02B1A6